MRFGSDGQVFASFECAAVDGNSLYFAEALGNEIFCWDMRINKISLLCTIREEDEYGKRLFGGMVIYEGDLFLFPFFATGIYRVNLQTGNYTVVGLPENSIKEYDTAAKFIDVHLYQDVIYAIPASFPGILKLPCNSNEVTVYDTWIQKIPDELLNADPAFFRKTLLMDNRIYAPSCKGNIVMIFDLRKGDCIVKEVGTKKCRFSGICYDKGIFWLSPRDDGPIIKWNENENMWWEYDAFPKDYIAGNTVGITIWRNKVMIFPQKANMILAVDCMDDTIKEWKEEYRGQNILWYGNMDDSVMFCMTETAEMIELKEENVRSFKLCFPASIQDECRKRQSTTYKKFKNGIGRGDILQETYPGALQDYFHYILHSEEKGMDSREKRADIQTD